MAAGPMNILASLTIVVQLMVDALVKLFFGRSCTEGGTAMRMASANGDGTRSQGVSDSNTQALTAENLAKLGAMDMLPRAVKAVPCAWKKEVWKKEDLDNLFHCSLPNLPVVEMRGRSGFVRAVAEQAPEQIRGALQQIVKLACAAQGRCAFAVAPRHALQDAQDSGVVRYRFADAGGRWPNGYMNTRLRNTRVQDEDFASAVSEWSVRTKGSVWPDNHEARGLSKDGFTALVDEQGRCAMSAIYIEGLPSLPYQWNGVGLLHSTALGMCWVLRQSPAAVVVRSIAGTVHVLLPGRDEVKAFKCEIPARAPSK